LIYRMVLEVISAPAAAKKRTFLPNPDEQVTDSSHLRRDQVGYINR
jgi:hypothetical protein